MPSTLASLTGTVLEERYRIVRLLGSGGMGAVFEARHLRLDMPVAIKVLKPAYASDQEYITRFIREAKSASRVRHRNVVEIFDYGEAEGGLVYTVMELLEGQDLEQVLKSRPEHRTSWDYARGVLIPVASGLKAAHEQGVIHRDIKPANCFLTDEDGKQLVKLVDFGIAKLEGGGDLALTGTAQVLGTPSYIAPELVRTDDPASVRSDIYALGVLMYRMLVGRVPFTARSPFELLRKACFDPVPSMRERVPLLPVEVEALVLQMLAKEPEARPSSMLEVRDRLVELRPETLMAGRPTLFWAGPPRRSAAVGDITRRSAAVGATPRRPPTEARTMSENWRLDDEDAQVLDSEESVITAVVSSPLPRRPGGGSPQPAVPRPVMTVPRSPGVPQSVVRDASFPSSPLPQTLSAREESTLHGVESSRPVEPPRRRSRWGLLLGALGPLVAAGTLAASEGHLGGVEAEPSPAGVAARSVTESARARPLVARPPATEPEANERREPIVELDEHSASPAEESARGVDENDVDDARPESAPRAARGSKRRSRRRATTRRAGSAVPPADFMVLEMLERRIASQCAEHLVFGSVTASFYVDPRGEVGSLTVSPRGPAGKCAARQVRGARFRSRKHIEAKKIEVR